jgi:hypothetical protein
MHPTPVVVVVDVRVVGQEADALHVARLPQGTGMNP